MSGLRTWRGRTGAWAERGSASVLMTGVMLVVVLLSCAAMVVAGYVVAAHRARAAADLAAVSGATAFGQGQDACGQARRTARDNGAHLLGCDQVGDQIDYVVTVRVAVAVRTSVRGLPPQVQSVAHAGSTGG